jgi:hypothetical protein
MSEAERVPPGVDPNKSSGGRMYDYLLGGTDNLEIDRQAVRRIKEAMPELIDWAWANRGFLQRATAWLAAEQGIRQFIDIGAGLPTRNNTHEAAQAVAPDTHVVYVDNDPMITAHARSLLAGVANTRFLLGDVREPDAIFDAPETQELIDFDRPVALLVVSLMHFIADEQDPWGLVRRYLDRLPSGSWLVFSHGTADNNSPQAVKTIIEVFSRGTEQFHFRDKAAVTRFFDGLVLAPPYEGAKAEIVNTGVWGAEDADVANSDGSRWGYCGVGRKP